MVRLRGDDFGDDLLVVVNDAVGVHHFRQALHSRIVVERVNRPVVQVCARLVHRRCRNARGKHEPHVDRQSFGRLEHVVDAVGAHDVGDFMGVGDDGRRAVRKRRADKFLRADEARFQMDVRVNEARADDLARHVVFHNAVVVSQTYDQPIGTGNVAGGQFVGKDVDKRRVLQNQIRLLPPGRRLDHLLLFQQLSLNLSCVALGCDCHENHPFFVFYGAACRRICPVAFGPVH